MVAFLRRLRGAFRRALEAEAQGSYDEAARLYALAGAVDKVAALHLLKAERAATALDEITALRDALRWSKEGQSLHSRTAPRLAAALVARARSEGVSTARDRESVREAAGLFEQCGAWADAGAAWELAGDDDACARAYEQGGLIELMEQALARTNERNQRQRGLAAAFDEYEIQLRSGGRSQARQALLRCCELAAEKGEYRRLLAELDARRLADNRMAILLRPSQRIVCLCVERASLGRDPVCDLVLRGRGVSRRHAEVVVNAAGFRLRDVDSRNGTFLDGVAVSGDAPVSGAGTVGLGDDFALTYAVDDGVLRLLPDSGPMLLLAAAHVQLDLEKATRLRATLWFRDGCPLFAADEAFTLNGASFARGQVELLRRDIVTMGDTEAEVL